jgi:hypothetical protein
MENKNMPSKIAADLARRWNVPVATTPGTIRYSEHGNWYHSPRSFPAALLDRNGYVIFATEQDFRSCALLQIGRKGDVGVRRGIRDIHGYVRMAVGADVPQPAEARQS